VSFRAPDRLEGNIRIIPALKTILRLFFRKRKIALLTLSDRKGTGGGKSGKKRGDFKKKREKMDGMEKFGKKPSFFSPGKKPSSRGLARPGSVVSGL
jgi:hypothetical protein